MTTRKPLRLWPGVALAALLLVLKFAVPRMFPEAGLVAILGALASALLIIVWWMFFSRAPWPERLGFLGLMIAAMTVTYMFLLHPSISGGNMGFLYFIIPPQFLALALVAWAVVTRQLPETPRRATMALTVVLACAAWALVRTDGVMGGGSEFHWR